MEQEQRPIIQSCSINGKTCRNGKRDDFAVDANSGERPFCHKWVKIMGKDPSTNAPIDTWCCNEFAKIKLMIESAQMTRHTTAEVNAMRTEYAQKQDALLHGITMVIKTFGSSLKSLVMRKNASGYIDTVHSGAVGPGGDNQEPPADGSS